MNTIHPGDTKRFYCSACQVEFELVLEPKLLEMDNHAAAQQMRREMCRQFVRCPFCGSDRLEEQ